MECKNSADSAISLRNQCRSSAPKAKILRYLFCLALQKSLADSSYLD
jgi:hypothetical protein